MDAGFLEELEEVRRRLGKPLIISSGYRCPEYNNKVSSTSFNGPHTTGKAIDILCRGGNTRALLRIALAMNFPGIGLNQKGAGRFIHLDRCDHRPPDEHIWTY